MGASVAKDFGVDLIVSAGPRPVNVPNVLGLDAATASSTVGRALFVVKQTRRHPTRCQQGNVISTSPAPNTAAPRGSSVTIVISTGPAQIEVKDVTGETQAEAQADLSEPGLPHLRLVRRGERRARSAR